MFNRERAVEWAKTRILELKSRAGEINLHNGPYQSPNSRPRLAVNPMTTEFSAECGFGKYNSPSRERGGESCYCRGIIALAKGERGGSICIGNRRSCTSDQIFSKKIRLFSFTLRSEVSEYILVPLIFALAMLLPVCFDISWVVVRIAEIFIQESWNIIC